MSVIKLECLQERHTHRKLAPVPRVGHRAAGRRVVHGGRPHSISRPHKSGRAHLISIAHVNSSIGRSGHKGQAAKHCLERHHIECKRIEDREGRAPTLAMVAPEQSGLNIPTPSLSAKSHVSLWMLRYCHNSTLAYPTHAESPTRLSNRPSRRLPLPPSPLSRAWTIGMAGFVCWCKFFSASAAL